MCVKVTALTLLKLDFKFYIEISIERTNRVPKGLRRYTSNRIIDYSNYKIIITAS